MRMKQLSDLNTAAAIAAGGLASNAVTAAKIASGAVTTAKLGADAVDGTKIADDAVDSEHIAAGAVDAAHLAADIVDGTKVADDAIDSEHLAAGAVDTTALGADAVTGAKVADNAIDSEHVTAGAIDNAHLAGSIATAKLADAAELLQRDGSVVMTGILDTNGNNIDVLGGKVVNLATPTGTGDAATKGYVDSQIQGLSPKEAIRAASTANVTLATGVENGDTLDGVTLATGDRILLKDQSTASENGVYEVAASGAPSRAADADSESDLLGMFAIVQEGTANADTGWILSTDGTITVDTTDLTYVAFSGVSGIADGSITTAKLGADSVTSAKIADDQIDSEHYVALSIDSEHLSLDVIDSGALVADDVIDSEHIAAGAIDNEHLAADVVNGAKIADDAVDSEHLAAGAIDPEHLAANAVETAKIADDAVTAAKLNAGIVSIGLAAGDAGDIDVTPSGTFDGSSVETNVDASVGYLGRPWVKLNDALYEVGTTGSGTDGFWFAPTGAGATVRGFGSIIAGDKLFVDTDTLGFTIDTTDRLGLVASGPNT